MRAIRRQTQTEDGGSRRRIIQSVFTLVIVALLLLSGCGDGGDSWEQIKQSGVLRIGIDPTFPPFALAEGADLDGIDVDLARALAAELGLEPQFTFFGYDGLYDALTTGQVDLLISALVIAPERTKEIAYTNPYFDAGLILIIPAEMTAVARIADLDGRKVAVELGTLGHVEALEWQKQLRDLTILPYGGAAETMAAVATGEADAALVDSVSGRLYLKDQTGTSPRLTHLPDHVTSEPYAIAVRIEDRMLLEALNRSLLQLDETGEIDTIINLRLSP